MQRAVELVRDAERILLSGHLRADGDCLGAQSVLFHALRALGKSPQLLLPDPPDGRYGFLKAHTPWTEFDGSLPEADLLVVCDCNDLSRLGAMGDAVRASGMKRIAVDHHPPGEDDGWAAWVHDVGAAASGLLALDFSAALGVDTLPPEAHEAAFVALMTDTGWLQHSNADAAAWRAAAELVAHGVDTNRVFGAVYQQDEAGRPRGVGATLATTEYHADGALAVAWATRASLEAADGTLADTDQVLDILRGVGAVEGVAVVTERPDGRVKVSFRSKHRLDVNQVARRVGGGGHARAAGATFPDGTAFDDCLAQARAALLAEWSALRP